MGPRLSRHYPAVSPLVVEDMTLRQIRAYLLAIAPPPADERTALMTQHPALRR